VEEEMLPTSANLMQKKKNMLTALLTLASALDVNVHISYSDYDLATLKEENPSSVLFDIFKQQNGDEATYEQYKKSFRQVGYFAGQVTGDHTIGRAYIAGKEVQGKNADIPEAFSPNPKQIAYAPTALEKFFQCPRKFFLTKLLGIREEETDDPFTVIDGKSLGTLAHTLMEELSENPCDRATFLQRADAAFDQFLLPRPPLHKEMAQREKMTFRKIMATAYDKDPGNEVLAAEEKQTFPHSSGILLEGYPDRVEKTPKGEYIIADYKTKKKIEHVENDIDTCLQVVIYAYMMEQKGVPITRCEYRYLRDGVTVGCQYDATMKEKLNDKLLMFKEALETGQFPCAPSENNCKYCTLANICGKDQQPEEGEAE
jgi:RecB family exonuclease